MAGFITSYVEGCDKCQHYQKDLHSKVQVHLQEVPERPCDEQHVLTSGEVTGLSYQGE